MKQQILVIGGTGMLGKPVALALKKAGHPVRIFSRSASGKEEKEGFEIFAGDLFAPDDLDEALTGCSAIHANLGKIDEGAAMKAIVEAAKRNNIETISCITGASVCEENRWFPGTEQKFQAEQALIHSGIAYMIFRPSWFFESLGLMVRDGKAMMLGKQPNPYRWVAARDYATMVAKAYQLPEAKNQIFYVFGPEYHKMRDLLVAYVHELYPGIKKVSDVPLWMMKVIGLVSGKKEMREVAALYGYFEKASEQGDPGFTNQLLGKPETTFRDWIALQKDH